MSPFAFFLDPSVKKRLNLDKEANDIQSRERTISPRLTMAYARAPLDDRNAQQARKHGTLPCHSLGLGGEVTTHISYILLSFKDGKESVLDYDSDK
jgi:hypothetical protein